MDEIRSSEGKEGRFLEAIVRTLAFALSEMGSRGVRLPRF